MNKALGFALAFISGILLGAAVGIEASKEKVRVEVEKQTAMITRAAKQAEEMAETRASIPTFDPELVQEHAVITTRYQVEPVEPNTGIYHISEDDYQMDEAFDKCNVEIFFTDDLPVFLFNGTQVIDWYDHLGPTIILDGSEQDNETFYVRNHSLRTDYEVSWGRP